MNKRSLVSNSERYNSNEDRNSNNCQEYARYYVGACSLVINDRSQNSLQRERRLHFTHNDNNNNDFSEEVQYKINEQSKKVCGYCRKDKHDINDCPLFINAVKQQSSILNTYDLPSSDDSSQLNHSTHYNETDRQHLEFWKKAQQEYYSKQCKYCKEFGHLEDKCAVLKENTSKQSEANWTKIGTKKSKKSKKNETLKTEIHNLSENDHSASDCVKETENKYLSKFCHYCKEYGHIEDICPSVQKALGKHKRKSSLVFPKTHKKDICSSPTTKIKDSRKLKTCHFCGKSDHKEHDCIEQKHQYEYFKKHEQYFKKQMHLKDVCPTLEEDVRKLENQNHKIYPNGQIATKDSNGKIKFSHMNMLNKCNFCGDSDHSESECEDKLQYKFISKYCRYCEEFGHFEDTCPLVEQAVRKRENQSYCSADDITAITENLEDLMICNICDEFGHSENDCFVRQQFEFYSKYCDHCEQNGHEENDCALKKQSSSNDTLSNNTLKKELEFKTLAQYASICSDHYVCDNCHSVYSNECNSTNSKKCTSENVRRSRSTSKASFEKSAHKLRYCTLCGTEGLIDTCILKEKSCY